jgi:HAD superfamily hydrolase (TIGR01509 family)
VAAHFGLVRDPRAWYREYRLITLDMMDKDLDLRPGVHQFLKTVDVAGLPIALVTSATTEHAQKALGKYALFDRFRAHVTADTPGLTARKPDPAPYLLAASLLGVDPMRCAAFEDSPAGVESALAAGCRVYAIPHAHSPAQGLMRAHVLLGSIDAFDPNDPLYP